MGGLEEVYCIVQIHPWRQILFVVLNCVLFQSYVTSILEAWSVGYHTAMLHISLVVSDPNHCAHLVSSELYAAYSLISKRNSAVALEHKTQTHRLDLYQNAVATAVATVVAKIKWAGLTAMPTGSEDRSKCIRKILSLLAWQLARFWDVAEKVRGQRGRVLLFYSIFHANTRTNRVQCLFPPSPPLTPSTR